MLRFGVACPERMQPHSQKAKDLLIGKGEDWRDKTHFRMSYGMAWADLTCWLPLLAVGSIGVMLGKKWGYGLWLASGAISVYINIIFWFSERAYVYPVQGPLAYYTYYRASSSGRKLVMQSEQKDYKGVRQ